MVGYTAGKKAARILKGEDPGEVPAGLAAGYSLWVNMKAAEAQGAKLPMVLVEKAADKIWDNQGKVVKGE
jgi:putative ABC transport system substrate-binding protein